MEYYLWFTVLSFVLSVILIFYTWKNRNITGSRQFFLTLLCIIGAIIVQAGELLSTTLQSIIVFANMYYLFIQFAPVCFLFLTLQITGNSNWQKHRTLMAILILVPVLTQVLLWTNSFHQLMRSDITIDDTGVFVLMHKTYGPAFWFAALYNFLLTFISLTMLAVAMGVKNTLYRNQSAFLFIGLLIPTTSTALTVFGILRLGIDPTPAVFGLSGLIMFWGIFRYRLFNAVPIAHSSVIKNMSTGIIVFDADNHIADINPAAEKLLHNCFQPLLGRPVEVVLSTQPKLLEIFQMKDSCPQEFTVQINNTPMWFEVKMALLPGVKDNYLGAWMTLHDITDRKMIEEKIQRMSLYEPLTELPNRKFFIELAKQKILQAKQHNTYIGVAFIDLDDFKTINDTWGHDFGDFYLKETARRLTETLSISDTVSRFGGDEFAMLLTDLKQYQDLKTIAQKIFRSFQKTVSEEKQIMSIRASIGFCAYPVDGEDIEALLKRADDGMYASKRRGKNCYTLSHCHPFEERADSSP